MPSQKPPFDPHAFADWLIEGLKDTVSYRFHQTFDPEKWIEYVREKIPNRTGALHFALKQIFERLEFKFEELKQGDAKFYLVRKRFREPKPGHEIRRLVIVPGFGDSPASWLPVFTFSMFELERTFDEVVVLDFPGYMGFLSSHAMVPSMEILLSVTKMVCEAYPPTVLLGHSLGGWLSAKVAQSSPKLMDHLILIAPAGLIPSRAQRERFAKTILDHTELPPEQMLKRIIHEPKNYHSLLSHDLQEFFAKEGVRQFVDSVEEHQFIDTTKPFSGARKLTVIWGENDHFVPSQGMRDWVENYGNYMDAYTLKETGHVPQFERPKTTGEVIFHALLGKPGTSGAHWKKILSRRQEWTNARIEAPLSAQQKLLT